MTPTGVMETLNTIMAQAWMVRTFLKHAEEIQDDEAMLEVPRMIFDYVRALEPSYQRRDAKEYLRRARGKLPKLRHVSDYFAAEYRRVSDHTNYQMAALSLSDCVQRIDEVLRKVEMVPGQQSPDQDQGGGPVVPAER